MRLTSKATILLLASIFTLSAINTLNAQSEKEDKSVKLNISLNSDQFFGFYPFVQGVKPVNDKMNFTFYGIFWSGGTGGSWGNWTEFGVGLNFMPVEGLSVTPQLGFLGGNLLSSGVAQPGVMGDGIVPNLTMVLDKNNFMGEFYSGFYLPLRDQTETGGETTLSYIHYWVNGGFKASKFTQIGLHFEHLINSGGSNVDESTDVYQWFGPFIQFSDPAGKHFTRFSFGTDFVEANDSFFKLTTGFNF
jgi:hypothetical protein